MRTPGSRVDRRVEDRTPHPLHRTGADHLAKVPSRHWSSQKGRAADLGTMSGPKGQGRGLDLRPPLTPAEKPALLGKAELPATSLGVGRPG